MPLLPALLFLEPALSRAFYCGRIPDARFRSVLLRAHPLDFAVLLGIQNWREGALARHLSIHVSFSQLLSETSDCADYEYTFLFSEAEAYSEHSYLEALRYAGLHHHTSVQSA